MPNQLGIIHPDLLTSVTPIHYPALCTIQQDVETQSDTGEITAAWGNLAGHVAIPCRIAPRHAHDARENKRAVMDCLYT